MNTTNYRKRLPTIVCWLLLAAFFFIGILVVVMIVIVSAGANSADFEHLTKNQTAIMSVLQNIIAFIIPAVVVAQLMKPSCGESISHQLRLDKAPALKWVLVVLAVYFVALPAMNWITVWNENVHLPSYMQRLEELFRASEDQAQEATKQLLESTSLLEMLAMFFVVAVLTGVGEEIFFRSSLLGTALDRNPRHAHLFVWTVAFIFSAFHLQFYGFVPRLLLGAWFGYLMLWSRSVWVPIIAHAFNNGMVVVFTYLVNNNILSENSLDVIGTTNNEAFPWLAIASAVLTIVLIAAASRMKVRTLPPPPPRPLNPVITND